MKNQGRSTFSKLIYDSDIKRKDLLIQRNGTGCDPVLLVLVLILTLFGTIMICSASYAYAAHRYDNSLYFIERQLIWVALGIAVMLGASTFTSVFYRNFAFPAYLFTLLLLLAVLIIGSSGNGAQRWISLGPLTIQPSEIAKTTLVLMLARYYSVCEEDALDIKNPRKILFSGTLIPFCLIGAVCVLVMLQKHLSAIIILGCIGIFVMFASGIAVRFLGAFCGAAAASVTCLALFTDYTKRRITIWLNPELYPLDGGWQTLQGLMAIGSGGFFGLGLGNSRLKYSYVSEPANDMIFTIICEELGFLGAASIIVLFALFAVRGYAIAFGAHDTFTRLTALGITTKVILQAALNICVVTNTIPNTGISLPFFSYGGSSLLMLLFEMGILLSLSRESHMRI